MPRWVATISLQGQPLPAGRRDGTPAAGPLPSCAWRSSVSPSFC